MRRTCSYEIVDDHKLDFFYVIKGVCCLEFKVRRIIDNRQQDSYKTLSEEEIERNKDIEMVQ